MQVMLVVNIDLLQGEKPLCVYVYNNTTHTTVLCRFQVVHLAQLVSLEHLCGRGIPLMVVSNKDKCS